MKRLTLAIAFLLSFLAFSASAQVRTKETPALDLGDNYQVKVVEEDGLTKFLVRFPEGTFLQEDKVVVEATQIAILKVFKRERFGPEAFKATGIMSFMIGTKDGKSHLFVDAIEFRIFIVPLRESATDGRVVGVAFIPMPLPDKLD